jgi:hypothetical protein
VLYGIYRLMILTYDKGSDSSLEKLILKDHMLWGDVVLWAVSAVVLTFVF